MPYITKPKRLSTVLTVVAAALLTTVAPAVAQAAVVCEQQPLSQPFLYANDASDYVLVPGESANKFEGAGWELTGGAKVVRTVLADGATSTVLEMPAGSKAVSPTFCITSAYPTARAMIADVAGAQGVSFAVSYEGTPSWKNPHNTGQIHGNHTEWTLTTPVNMQPENVAGWQHARITLVAASGVSDYRLYNLYVDPYSR